MISVAYATIITVPRWVASPEDWYRLSCTRLAHDPLPHDPASVSSEPELVAAGTRVGQAALALMLTPLQG